MMDRREEITIVPEDDCEIYEYANNPNKVGTDDISVFCCSDVAVEEGGK